MARCPPDRLIDVEDVLDDLRTWPGVKEKSVACFYVKSAGFLHFHVDGDKRWADVRDGDVWGEPLPLAFAPTKGAKVKFLRAVRLRYEKIKGGSETKNRRSKVKAPSS